MKDRILAFLQNENKSYAQFAEEIGVQPSGISHILSGRNNPSLDFVIKMLHRYPSLSADWLLFGKGSMYKYLSQPTLFDTGEPPAGNEEIEMTTVQQFKEEETGAREEDLTERQDFPGSGNPDMKNSDDRIRKLERIVMFYTDKTFTEYKPS